MTAVTGTEFKTEHPAPGTLWVTGWRCLNHPRDMAEFLVERDGADPSTIYVNKNKRRILEALIDNPMYCASPCRLSHYVMLLREEQGLNIETEWYSNDPKTGRERFGVYVLKDKVTRITGSEVRQ